MHNRKRAAAVLSGLVLGAGAVAGTGIAVAAVVTPGQNNTAIHMCYTDNPRALPNNYVQFRSENYGQCNNGYHHFMINQPQDAGINANGPYPGATQLSGTRANSTETWEADQGAKMQRSWVKCADGEVATGGGFSAGDEALQAKKGMQVLNSSPAQIVDGKVTTIEGGYTPIAGDPDGAFKPNGWVVEGLNNNTETSLVVRPFVVCGKG